MITNSERRLPEIPEPNDEALLWRYMDFTKYVSDLHAGGFWLPRSDLFDDKFEASYPIANDRVRREQWASTRAALDLSRSEHTFDSW